MLSLGAAAITLLSCRDQLAPADDRSAVDVVVTTTGQDLDPDGYRVVLDGGQSRPVAVNGTVAFEDVPAGSHSVELVGLAENCAATGSNPRSLTVQASARGSVSMGVACAAYTGDLTVTVSTAGADTDPDGYLVAVHPVAGQGGPASVVAGSAGAAAPDQSQPVGANGMVTFPGLPAGEYTVELTEFATNCAVVETNPTTASVPAAGTAATAFSVGCTARAGDLDVTTTTAGSDRDPDGYTVTVDDGQSQAIGINESVTFAGVAEGDHTVELTGLASNCTVDGANPRTVAVPYGETGSTGFTVSCTMRLGDLDVAATTTGSDLDPDGYAVTVDGGSAEVIDINGSATFTGLIEGDHAVELTGVASNCVVSGANPRTVAVPYGGTATTTFSVTCAELVGNLDVTATTTGSDLDPDGYTVTVDGGPSQIVGSNGAVTFTGLSGGMHSVELTDVAGNCTVTGANPRTIAVPYGGTATTAFDITCTARVGGLDVTTTTSGSDLDPDGYAVTVDGGSGQAIGINGSVTFLGLAEGDHAVELTGVAGNCTVSGSNPRTVAVPYGGTATTAFDVSCATRLGDLDVAASTTGSDLDPDGYTVTVDGGSGQAIGINGSVTFLALTEGDHAVELTSVAANCTVNGANPRTVAVPFGGTATTAFSVTCATRVGALDVTTTTTGSDLDPDGYFVTIDGGAGQPVGINGSVTWAGLTEGDHTVELLGVAANCAVSGANPRTVAVPYGGTATTAFDVACATRLGDLAVTTATTGSDLDPDGYTVTVDGGSGQAIGINGSVTFLALTEGDHVVELTGLAGNCTVNGVNPRTVAVPFGGTATTAFSVTCGTRVGDLDVTATTTGSDLDPDGYMVAVDGGPGQAIGINGSVGFTGLTEGDHSVELLGVAANCTVSGVNPRTVAVPFGGTGTTAFSVTCASRLGDLDVTTATTGSDLDPDGYMIAVDGGPGQAIGINGSVGFTGLTEGDHSVELLGVAANCTVSGANPRTVTVPYGGTASTAYTVTCAARLGDLDVTASTTGSDQDPDGYTVTVDGGPSQPIGINGSVTFIDLAEGDHAVELLGVAANCTVSGANPRTVAVPFGGTASTAFAVTCSTRVGDLDVTASTTGSDLDPNGYTVTVDAAQSQPVATNGTVSFTGLTEGDHSVQLLGVAANCTVSGANPRTVTVPFGGTAATTFSVSCTALVGDLDVTTTSTGSDVDPDGYTVTVDGTTSQTIASNGSVTFIGLSEGNHSVELTDVAGNCTVSGANPRAVMVPDGGTVTTAFGVTCVARLGDLDVTTSTTGSDLDPDGYAVTVDGGPGQPMAITDSITFTGLAEGDHTVELTGMAGNCTVSGANPRTVTVPYQGTATTAFTVTCVPRVGDIRVTTSTTGNDVDPDGYTVTVDGGSSQPVGVNESVTFTGLAEGDHTVELTGLASNCTVSANPRTVTVVYDNTVNTAFAVTCVARVGDLDVTTTTTGADLDPDGYTVTVDGTTSQAVGVNGSVTFSALAEGDHTVELTGLADNCTVSGSNPRTETVVFNDTVTAAFSVDCVARVGELDVTTSTTGQELDPNGYTVVVDGGPSQSIGINGSVTFTGLAEGDHSVELTGVAGNCTVSGANPRTVAVTFAGAASTAFSVTCVPSTGDLRVSVTTTGSSLDPDGYTVTVDGGSSQPIGINDTVWFYDVPFGDRSVQLSGVAITCTVITANPQTVTVPGGGTGTATFTISCGDQILVGAGDISSCDNDRDEYTAQILDTIPGVVFTTGDNAYPDGRTQDYQNCYDPTWGRHKDRTWAQLGNHEYNTGTAQPSFDYFGDRVGPEGLGYYSFDIGAWHVIVLNDNGDFVPFDAGSTQDQWLQADLAANTSLCTMAIWHQPRFHSSTSVGGATERNSRKIFWDRLYAAGADVVAHGHNHWYERFTPMDADGNVDLSQGIREFIIGTGGDSSAEPVEIAANSEARSKAFGVMKFTLRADGYDWEFIPALPAGTTFTDAGTGTCH